MDTSPTASAPVDLADPDTRAAVVSALEGWPIGEPGEFITAAEAEELTDFLTGVLARRAAAAEVGHRCGYDFDPYCDGCRTAAGDAGF